MSRNIYSSNSIDSSVAAVGNTFAQQNDQPLVVFVVGDHEFSTELTFF